mmetsp:Transcript_19138/g.45938  ORF Transcript_19138/g.45938 Transcript_19138/m.45938 type:complete len:129 (+) Transcript_19138:73-459(+)
MVVANMTILSEVVNATLILVISEVDSVMLIKWHPSTKWQAFAQDLYRAALFLAPLSTLLAYFLGLVSADLDLDAVLVRNRNGPRGSAPSSQSFPPSPSSLPAPSRCSAPSFASSPTSDRLSTTTFTWM